MEIKKGIVVDAPPTTNHQNHEAKTANHQNHQKPPNLMEIRRNGRGCPKGALPKTTKTIKQKQLKPWSKSPNLMEIKKTGRGALGGALPQTTKTNKQKQPTPPTTAPNLMEINEKW